MPRFVLESIGHVTIIVVPEQILDIRKAVLAFCGGRRCNAGYVKLVEKLLPKPHTKVGSLRAMKAV
jgi:hypothetical protein